jgi:hypothetical protein
MIVMTLKEKENLYEQERVKTACLVDDLMCILSNLGVSEKQRVDKAVNDIRGQYERSNSRSV